MESFLKIPRKRVVALVGKNSRGKKQIEQELECKLDVSSSGDVEIDVEDPLKLLKGESIIKAIGRGFNPDDALMLLDDAYVLDVINLEEYVGKRKTALKRQKARIIGSEGKTKRKIEELSDTKISIYGKTVSIIGEGPEVVKARQAIVMIAHGAKQGTAYAFLERSKK